MQIDKRRKTMNTQNSRSKQLLDKVYDHLNTIDVSKLSMRELEDFLGVVQKGQFLENYGNVSFPLFSGIGGFKPQESAGKETTGEGNKE